MKDTCTQVFEFVRDLRESGNCRSVTVRFTNDQIIVTVEPSSPLDGSAEYPFKWDDQNEE